MAVMMILPPQNRFSGSGSERSMMNEGEMKESVDVPTTAESGEGNESTLKCGGRMQRQRKRPYRGGDREESIKKE